MWRRRLKNAFEIALDVVGILTGIALAAAIVFSIINVVKDGGL